MYVSMCTWWRADLMAASIAGYVAAPSSSSETWLPMESGDGLARLRQALLVGVRIGIGDAVGDPSFVKRVGPLVGDRAQRSGEILQHETIASGPRAAARFSVRGDRCGKPSHRTRQLRVESAREGG